MRDSFDNIRAERESPSAPPPLLHSRQCAGLWKQIAIGIVIGHLTLGLIGAVVWTVAAQVLVGDLQIVMPWSGEQE